MYPRNAASPPRIYVGPVVQISDGAVQTSGVAVTVTPEGGSETAAAGTVAYSTKGGVWYTPTKAETNYTAFVVEASKTGCIPAGVVVVTGASATAGRTMPADGSITAAALATDAVTEIQSGLATSDNQTAIAAHLTDIKGGTWSGTTDSLEAIRDRGDAAWATATGFSTHSAADVVAALGTGAGLTSLASAANLAALTAYVDTEVAAILEDTGTTLPASIAALATAAAVAACKAILDKLDNMVEAVP